MLRFLAITCIDVIGRNGHLGEIVKERIEQNLRRQYGQKHIRPSHTKHIAEVGADAHQQVFDDVAKGFASLKNPIVQNP